jgi:hypothetical protein
MSVQSKLIHHGFIPEDIGSYDKRSVAGEIEQISNIAESNLEEAFDAYRQLTLEMKRGGFSPLEAKKYFDLGKQLEVRGKKYSF